MADVLVTVPRAIESGASGPLAALYRDGHTVRHVRANATAVADFAMGLLLAVARWIPTFDRDLRERLHYVAFAGVSGDRADGQCAAPGADEADCLSHQLRTWCARR